jgi:hypothetical protein
MTWPHNWLVRKESVPQIGDQFLRGTNFRDASGIVMSHETRNGAECAGCPKFWVLIALTNLWITALFVSDIEIRLENLKMGL